MGSCDVFLSVGVGLCLRSLYNIRDEKTILWDNCRILGIIATFLRFFFENPDRIEKAPPLIYTPKILLERYIFDGVDLHFCKSRGYRSVACLVSLSWFIVASPLLFLHTPPQATG